MPPIYPPLDPDEQSWSLEARDLSPEDLARLRSELARSPDDARLRTMLVSAQVPKTIRSGPDAELIEHLEWFLAHRPGSRTLLVLAMILGQRTDPAVRARVDVLMRAHGSATDSPIVLGSIAGYFAAAEPEKAKELLLRARALDPENAAAWDERLRQAEKSNLSGVRGRAATERALGHALPRDSRQLGPADIAELEERVARVPGDLAARAILVQAYLWQALKAKAEKAPEAEAAVARLRVHACWLVANAPHSREAGDAGPSVDRLDPAGFAELAALWERKLPAHPADAAVHGNAARFFALHDQERALSLLERAREIEPVEPSWSFRIAHQIELQASSVATEDARRALLKRIHEELDRAAVVAAQASPADARARRLQARSLARLAQAALAAGGETERAEEVAQALLSFGPESMPSMGLAHEARLLLGLVALRRGDTKQAAKQLRAAASEAFPFRAGWQKRMQLVRELYDAGDNVDRDAVREYLEADLRDAERVARNVGEGEPAVLASFSGRGQVASWLDELRAGRRPRFPS